MKQIKATDGVPLLIQGLAGTPETPLAVKIVGKPSFIKIAQCVYLDVYGITAAAAAGEPDIARKPWLVSVLQSSVVRLHQPVLRGLTNDESKQDWMHRVPNGISICPESVGVVIHQPDIERCHVGVALRGVESSVLGGEIRLISGDHVQMTGKNCRLKGAWLRWSLDVWPYERWHRDLVQGWGVGVNHPEYGVPMLHGARVEDCVLETRHDPAIHPWSAPAQSILFSDGIVIDAVVAGNTIYAAHPIAILSTPMIDSQIADNTVYIEAGITPVIGCEDRKHYGFTGIRNRIENNTVETLPMNATAPASAEQQPGCPFDNLIGSLKNTQAPAITEEDYQAASARLKISVAMIKAVFEVESSKSGFNSDGSVKILFERHKMYKECVNAGIDPKQAIAAAGSDIINKKPGGYKGDIAEYWRAKQASRIDAERGVEMAIRSASWGRPQIMGFNHELAGYPSALAMVKAFHENEDAHLWAFCTFLENTGLAKHLREAERLIAAGQNPMKALDAFADGYNGSRHQNYDAKIAATYRKYADMPVEFKPMKESRTMRGAGTSILGKAAGVGGLLELQQMLQEIKDTKAQVQETQAAVTDGIAQFKQEISSDIDSGQWLLWVIIAVLLLSKLGDVQVIWARITDRFAGYH